MLSDVDLRAALESGELVVDPIEPHQVQPASIDLRLGDTFARLPAPDALFPGWIDPLAPPTEEHEHVTVPDGEQYGLAPHAFVLASTVETVGLDVTLAGQLAGKSSMARHGLIVESAGFVDPAWCGELTLEVANLTDRWVMLTPGMPICQLVVWRLDTPCQTPYGSKKLRSRYQGQAGPTTSRSHMKVENRKT